MESAYQIAADTDEFPRFGARARQWQRFERGLEAWLETPHGRFAAWRAERMVDGEPPFCARSAPHLPGVRASAR